MITIAENLPLQHIVMKALLFLGLVLVGTALANTSDTGVQESGGIEEVVVIAQRREELLEDVPLSVTVQSGDYLERAGITDMLELGNVVPGLTFNTQGPFASATIRGVQSMIHQAGSESPVAVYVDGVYQNNQTTTIFELADVEQITVLRGPQGTLFGRNATAGAVLIETFRPQFEASGRVSVDYGQFNGSDTNAGDAVVKAYFTAPLIADKLAFSLSAYYRDMEGFLTNDVTGGQSGDLKNYTVRAKLLFEATERASFLLTAATSDRDDFYSGSTTALNGIGVAALYPDGVVAQEPWHVASNLYKGTSPIWSGSDVISLKADFTFDAGSLSSVTGYTENEARYDVDLDTGTSALCRASFACLEAVDDNPNKVFQQELVFASEQFGGFSFVAGAYYYNDEAKIQSLVAPFLTDDGMVDRGRADLSQLGLDRRAVIKTAAYAVFGEASYDLSDTWHAIFGLRYSKEKKHGEGNVSSRFPTTGDLSDDAVTPRFSIRHDLRPNTNVYFTYSQGFKSSVLVGTDQNDDFARPEKLKNYEVGLKTSGERYRLSASAFIYDYKDLQAQFWNGTSSVLSNAENAKIRGLEVEGLFNVTDAFQIQGGISWLPKADYVSFSGIAYSEPMGPGGMVFHAVDASGDRMIKSPKFTANVTLSYSAETSLGTFLPSLTAFHTSEYWFDLLEQVTQDAYTTVNMRIAFRPAGSDSLECSVFARNVTNEDYFTSTLLGPSAHAPVYSPPRQIGVGFSYRF